MISWFNAPNEGLSPGGQLTLKTLTATENKTYSEEGTAYTSVTVNVEGGGSSDFRFVEITISGEMRDFILPMPVLFDNEVYVVPNPGVGTFQVPIYKNFLGVNIAGDWDSSWFSTTGNVSFVDGAFIITGDGTITIS